MKHVDRVGSLHHQSAARLHPYAYQGTRIEGRRTRQWNIAGYGWTGPCKRGCRSRSRSHQVEKNGRKSFAACWPSRYRKDSNRPCHRAGTRSKGSLLPNGCFWGLLIRSEEDWSVDGKLQKIDWHQDQRDQRSLVRLNHWTEDWGAGWSRLRKQDRHQCHNHS